MSINRINASALIAASSVTVHDPHCPRSPVPARVLAATSTAPLSATVPIRCPLTAPTVPAPRPARLYAAPAGAGRVMGFDISESACCAAAIAADR